MAARPLLPTLSLVLSMLLWASSFIALKLAFRFYHPMWVIFGRMAVASLLFLFWLPQFRTIRFRRRDLPILAGMALCEPCLYFILEAKALENTSASQAALITTLMPLMVAVGAALAFKEKLSGRALVGFAVAIGGAGLLSVGGGASEGAPNPLLGNFCELLAMLCATGYTLFLKRLTSRYPPFFLTAFQAFVGTLFFLPFLFLPGTLFPAGWPLQPTLAVVYLGLFVTLGAYALYNFAVSRIPAGQAAAFINLIPVLTLLLARLILDERLTLMQYLAGGLVFLGVFLSQEKASQAVPTAVGERVAGKEETAPRQGAPSR
ncbi:MAG: DMT family transporter [Deltaproteobacteria bacterium]|nr:DMT family transporter [Deltaproteobacteria bacterium]